jgi:hypothetical protein
MSPQMARIVFNQHGMSDDDWREFQTDEGKRNDYPLMTVLGWLGYCCPNC